MLTWISEFSVFNLRNKCEFLSNCNYRNGNQLWIYDAKSHSISECKMIFSPLLCGINKFWVTVFFLLNTTKEKWWFIIGITLLKHIVRSHSVFIADDRLFILHTHKQCHISSNTRLVVEFPNASVFSSLFDHNINADDCVLFHSHSFVASVSFVCSNAWFDFSLCASYNSLD